MIGILVALPALLALGWFAVEQFPVWLAPRPAWQRYPDIAALLGGCEIAQALDVAGAARITGDAAPGSAARAAADALLARHFPDRAFSYLITPEAVQFADGSRGSLSVVRLMQSERLESGAVVLLAGDGTPKLLASFMGVEATGNRDCGSFAPVPAGLRARLRPYLPLLAFGGYAAAVAIAIGWTQYRKRRMG
jgi:hypothetical protein